jgi:hypothetical protein
MPQIPDFAPRTGLIPDAPPGADLGNPGSFGAVGDAVEKFGAGAANIGLDLLEKRKQAQDHDYAFTQALQDQRDFAAYSDELKKKMPQDFQGYTQSLNQWISSRYEENQKNAPSNTSKEIYQSMSGSFFNKEIVEATGLESQQRALSYKKNLEDQIDKNSSLLVQIPDQPTAYDLLDTANTAIDAQKGKSINSALADVLKDRNRNLTAKGLLDGLYAKGLGADPLIAKQKLQQGIDILQGNEQGTNPKKGDGLGLTINSRDLLVDGLLPHERSEYLDKFTKALNSQTAVDLTELKRRMRDDIAAQSQGLPFDPTLVKDLSAAVQSGNMTNDQRVRFVDDQNSAYVTGKIVEAAKTSPRSQWDSLWGSFNNKRDQAIQTFIAKDPTLDGATKPNFNMESRVSFNDSIPAELLKVKKAQEEDAAQYVLGSHPGTLDLYNKSRQGNPADIKAYIDTSLARQNYLEIPKDKQRVITKTDAKAVADNLGQMDPNQVANNFSTYEKLYGPHFSDVMNQVAADQNDEKFNKLWVAHFVTDQTARTKMIANVINAKEIDKAFKGQYTEEDNKALDTAVRDTGNSVVNAFAQKGSEGGYLGQANAIRDMIILDAKKRMTTANGSVTPEDAVQQAMGVVNSTFGTSTTANSNNVYPHTQNGTMILPQVLDAYKLSHMQPEALSTMNLSTPLPGYYDKGLSQDDIKTRFYKDIGQYGYWQTNGTNDGMILKVDLPRAGKVTVQDANGHPIEVKYVDIMKKMDPFTTGYLNRGKNPKPREFILKD